MTDNIQQRNDGRYELPLHDGRVAVADDRDALANMAAAQEHAIHAEAAFLGAWKAGVELAGAQWFEVTSATVAQAVDKDQLRPAWEMVNEHSGVLSHGERVFLYALCGFFNDEWGRELFAHYGETGQPIELARILDPDRRHIIADLLIHYRGW